jgi:DNA-binding GntR family transcriptional regulator
MTLEAIAQTVSRSRRSTADFVADVVRAAILSGQLEAGERIIQEEVASQLGVSRQPVRDALRRLEHEGVVIQSLTRGTVVRAFSLEDIEENYSLRIVLESVAAQRGATTADDALVRQLQRYNDDLKLAASESIASEILTANHNFHRTIWLAAGSPILVQFLDRLWVGFTVTAPLSVPKRMTKSLSEHAGIINAIASHDSVAAEELMRSHIDSARSDYEEGLPMFKRS